MSVGFSVVVPTYRRPDTLFQVLDGLERQRAAPDFEVVVIDDGSGDGTPKRLAAYRPAYPFRFFSQANAGPAAARNRGIEEARGRYLLFLGDDTVPEPEFVSVHARAHRDAAPASVAVLGYTTWPRGHAVSPFLHHINEYGLQFGYGLIEDPESVPFNFFYTSNISLERDRLREAGLFDTSFPHAAWEDIEISYRLIQRGLKIVYRPEAVARHHHRMTFASFRRRQEKSGRAAAIFFAKHPELADFLGVPQARAFQEPSAVVEKVRAGWATLAQRWDFPGARKALDAVLRDDYLRGLRRALESPVEASAGPARRGGVPLQETR